MNEKRLNLSMGQYIYVVITVILLLCGITYLLSSCTEQEIPGKPRRTGPMVDVNFTLIIGSFGSDVTTEPVTRSAAGSAEAMSNVIRVASDVYMYATLEKERPVTTRAGEVLAEGALVRVIAYSGPSFTFEEGVAVYKVVSGELEPVGEGLSLQSDTYKFVAYTFNDDNPLPAHASSTDIQIDAGAIDSVRYLLWGTETMPFPGVDNTVEITVEHRYSRVKIAASTASIQAPPVNINKIAGATLTPSYRILNLNLTSGQVTPVSSGNPESSITEFKRWRGSADDRLTWSAWVDTTANLNEPDVESDYYLIFPHATTSEMALKIGNLRVDNTDLGAYEFRFSNPQFFPMQRGHSYVLSLNFHRLIWAGSNIFWDGSKLTFRVEGTPLTQQGYQGVYFMWGSLVGISPMGNFTSSTPIYWPTNSAPYTYSQTTTGSLNNIPKINGGGSLITETWLDNHESRNYPYSEVHDPSARVGDICAFLSDNNHAPVTMGGAPETGSWRMPNSREFGILQSEYALGNLNNINNVTITVAPDGRTDFYDSQTNPGYRSYIVKSASSTVFPAGGHRLVNGNRYQSTYYLSGSPTSTSDPATTLNASFSMVFLYNVLGGQMIFFNSPTPLGLQGLVRCIKLDGGGIPISWTTPTVDVEDWDDGGTFGDGSTGTAGQGDVLY